MAEGSSKTEETTPKADTSLEETEGCVTMLDVLKDEAELEEDANAVLGGSDDKNCTYLQGYLKRQALYACMTCTPSADKESFRPAGVCLACSYQCHEGHELVELYTKRAFRCDCGNERFPKTNKCRLQEQKTGLNQENQYNQNFEGVYCTCHRPYPDPDDNVDDEMIQCIVCEDWYHGRHLQLEKHPYDADYAEMICVNCCKKHGFLMAYSGLIINKVSNGEATPNTSVTEATPNTSVNEATPNTSINVDNVEVDKAGEKEKDPVVTVCLVKDSKVDSTPKTLFLPEGWRNKLCRCLDCDKTYTTNTMNYLLDPEDTVHFYEAKGKEKAASQYEDGMKALSELDRVKQVEAIQSYNSMKTNLMEYLAKFAENGKVVREEDIKEFFEGMESNKKQKVEIPKFCR